MDVRLEVPGQTFRIVDVRLHLIIGCDALHHWKVVDDLGEWIHFANQVPHLLIFRDWKFWLAVTACLFKFVAMTFIAFLPTDPEYAMCHLKVVCHRHPGQASDWSRLLCFCNSMLPC